MMAGNNRLKELVLFFAIGLALLGGIAFVIDYGAGHSDDAQTGKINKMVLGYIDPQIIFFGSSVGEVGINTPMVQRQTGKTAFDMCLDGTRFIQYKGLIDEYVSRTKNNQIVVLSESYFSFEPIHAVNAMERYLAHINDDNIYKWLYFVQPGLAWKCMYVPFYKYVAVTNVYYKNAAVGWRNIRAKKMKPDTLLGCTPVNRAWEADQDEAIAKLGKVATVVDSGIVAHYIATIKAIQQHGSKVVIMLPPIYTVMANKITDHTIIRNALSDIASKTGATFWDFTQTDVCDHKENFYNAHHLNLTGSLRFTSILCDSLNGLKGRAGL